MVICALAFASLFAATPNAGAEVCIEAQCNKDPSGGGVSASGQITGESSARVIVVVDPKGGKPGIAPLPKAKAGNARRWDCRYYDYKANDFGGQVDGSFLPYPGAPATKLEAGTTYILMCNDENGQPVQLTQLGYKLLTWTDQSKLTSAFDDIPEIALAGAVADKDINVPMAHFSISPDTGQLIGLPTWFWVTQFANPVPDQAVAGGLVARIEAVANTADGLEIDPGDHPGPPDPARAGKCRLDSTPWVPGATREDDPGACRFTYQHLPPQGTVWTAHARVRYDVRWWVDGRADLGEDLDPVWSPWFDIPLNVKGTQAMTAG
jgi:hypothetical protein